MHHPGRGELTPQVVAQVEAEHLNGDGRHLATTLEDQEDEPVTESPVPSGDTPLDRGQAPDHDRVLVRTDGPGGDEFENFHRSFTIATNNPLDAMAARAAFGPFPDPNSLNNVPDPIAPSAASPVSPVPPVNPAGIGPQEQHEPPQASSSSPPPPPPPSQHQHKEDPTVVQARRSMMARTGDRHARGKLPEPKEGRFLPPDCLPLEPQIPATRSSKRYMKHKKRSPDVFEGCARMEDSKDLEDDEHIVACRNCNVDVVVKKAAVLICCESCGKVNPASSVNRSPRPPS